MFILNNQIKDEIFRKSTSGAQVGTSPWSMNVSHMSNAKKGPIQDFNAYQEFTDVELDAQILACCMIHFGMKTIDGNFISKPYFT